MRVELSDEEAGGKTYKIGFSGPAIWEGARPRGGGRAGRTEEGGEAGEGEEGEGPARGPPRAPAETSGAGGVFSRWGKGARRVRGSPATPGSHRFRRGS